MKIYAVISKMDYHVCAVTTNKHDANRLKEKCEAYIEEFETKDTKRLLKSNSIYDCEYFEGKIELSSNTDFEFYSPSVTEFSNGKLVTQVAAKTKKEAQKLAMKKILANK